MNARTSSKFCVGRVFLGLAGLILALLVTLTCLGCTSGEKDASLSGQTDESSTVATEGEGESTPDKTTTSPEGDNAMQDSQEANVDNSDKTLVVYFSGTGHTARIAEMVAQASDGELFLIEAAQPYTEEELSEDGYYGDNRPYNESKDSSIRPELASTPIENPSSYARVFLGYPIWYGHAPDIIYSFLDQNDFGQVPIYPFCTSGSSGIEGSADLTKSIYPSLNLMPGMRFSATATQEQVDAWVDSVLRETDH